MDRLGKPVDEQSTDCPSSLHAECPGNLSMENLKTALLELKGCFNPAVVTPVTAVLNVIIIQMQRYTGGNHLDASSAQSVM